jgi:hypothetical protein
LKPDAYRISKHNSRKYPDLDTVLSLGQMHVNWSGLLVSIRRFDEAIARADAGLSRLEPAFRNEPNDRDLRDFCLKLHGNRAMALGQARRHREAAGEWSCVLELSAAPIPLTDRIQIPPAPETARSPAVMQEKPGFVG